jgi:post-segregation antitoxin (ccd killing protein)
MNEASNPSSTWKTNESPRGNCHNKTDTKTTVSLYLNRILVEKARIHKLNISRITEQALTSILDYLEAQNKQTATFLGEASFAKEGSLVRSPGFEPGIISLEGLCPKPV